MGRQQSPFKPRPRACSGIAVLLLFLWLIPHTQPSEGGSFEAVGTVPRTDCIYCIGAQGFFTPRKLGPKCERSQRHMSVSVLGGRCGWWGRDLDQDVAMRFLNTGITSRHFLHHSGQVSLNLGGPGQVLWGPPPSHPCTTHQGCTGGRHFLLGLLLSLQGSCCSPRRKVGATGNRTLIKRVIS